MTYTAGLQNPQYHVWSPLEWKGHLLFLFQENLNILSNIAVHCPRVENSKILRFVRHLLTLRNMVDLFKYRKGSIIWYTAWNSFSFTIPSLMNLNLPQTVKSICFYEITSYNFLTREVNTYLLFLWYKVVYIM